MKKVATVLLLAALLAGCALVNHAVVYQVTGTAASVSVTYVNENGGTSQVTGAPLPWTYSFTAHVGDFLYVSAQNEGATGSVTATATENGSIVQTSTSSGAYVIATASGTI